MRAKLMAESIEEDIDEIYAQNIFILEKELGGSAATHENSLLLKFFNQLEYLRKSRKEEEREMNKAKSSKGTLR